MYKLSLKYVQLLAAVLLIDLSCGGSVSEYLHIDNDLLYRVVSCTASCMKANLNSVSETMFSVFEFFIRYV